MGSVASVRIFLKLALDRLYMPPAVTAARNLGRSSFIPFRPIAGTILVTHACNFRCLMCAFGRGTKPEGELETEEIFDIIRQYREMGLEYCTFSGGEPLLRKDLVQLVAEAKRCGFPNIQVTTNGSLLTEKRARELLDAGMNRISVSIDGYGETHEVQRQVPGAWVKTTDALRLLARLRDESYKDLALDVPITLSPLNRAEIPQLLELCTEVRAALSLQFLERASFFCNEHTDSRVSWDANPDAVDKMIDDLHELISHKQMTPLISHLALEHIRRYLKRENVLNEDGLPCSAGYMMIFIDALGRVYSGCWAMPPIGNVREKRLRDIVRSDAYRGSLDDMMKMNCPTCPNGYIWSTWYYLPTTLKEIAYRAARRARGGAPLPLEQGGR
jgi:MoaA/NifB/PqqE/SkfB family radical SAM enzyme